MTSKEKGNIGLGRAIAFATANNMIVSLPLNDAQDYDIIFDNGTLLKVQVKYTTNNTVDKRVRGHKNTKGEYYIKKDVKEPDYYFIAYQDKNYFIPSKIVKDKQTFTITEKYDGFMV